MINISLSKNKLVCKSENLVSRKDTKNLRTKNFRMQLFEINKALTKRFNMLAFSLYTPEKMIFLKICSLSHYKEV